MARLVQANLLISDHGDDGYRVFGTLYFTLGNGLPYALDVDELVSLKTGDPRINGQLEDIVMHVCGRLLPEERNGYPHKRAASAYPRS